MNVVICVKDVRIKEALQKKDNLELFIFDKVEDIDFAEFDLIIVDLALCSGKLDVVKLQSNKTVFVISDITEKMINDLIDFFKVGEYPFKYTFSGKEYEIDLNDIVYFESRHREVRAYFENGDFVRFYSKLDDVQKMVDDYVFFLRINKSYLVNHEHCTINKGIVSFMEKEIPVSRTYKKEFMKRLKIIKNM